MKVVIVNKSDSTGGAAVVSRRLAEALRECGVEVRMLVAEKNTDSRFVELAASSLRLKQSFLAERLKIFLANGLDRETLFKIDTASDGVPLHRHPAVREADVVCLNWVNQGLLSLKGLEKIFRLGKPVVWTMHDMWNFTGICHHAGTCPNYIAGDNGPARGHCGDCPLMKAKAAPGDLSHRILDQKAKIYGKYSRRLTFVAVSNWLAGLARRSTLLERQRIEVIPNAFPFPAESAADKRRERRRGNDGKFRIVMGAARLDDPVKGLPILVEATKRLAALYPDLADKSELVTFGNVKNPDALQGIAIAHRHLGLVSGEDKIKEIYEECDAVVSTSLYETLPGTLVEGLAYGCVPVCFNRGGQSDIVDHLSTGYIASWSDDLDEAATRIAEGLSWAARTHAENPDLRPRMEASARERFSALAVARKYIALFRSLIPGK